MLLKVGKVVYFGRADMVVDDFTSVWFRVPPAFSPPAYFVDFLIEPETGSEEEVTDGTRIQATTVARWRNVNMSVFCILGSK